MWRIHIIKLAAVVCTGVFFEGVPLEMYKIHIQKCVVFKQLRTEILEVIQNAVWDGDGDKPSPLPIVNKTT